MRIQRWRTLKLAAVSEPNILGADRSFQMAQSTNQKEEVDRLVEFLDELIVVAPSGEGGKEATPRMKIELLERALETWRFYAKQPDNELSLEKFTECDIYVDNGRVMFRLPEKEPKLGAGTPPIRLQLPLLIFLLLYHRDQFTIYDIIQKFIGKIHDDLGILDFKKTRTGVTRCFTNTRLAATTLRQHGLLKFTQKEAFKTWVLSLPGILVASKAIQDGQPWRLPAVERRRGAALHDSIRTATMALRTYDQMVNQLNSICRPNVEVFKTFEPVLLEAHKRLPGYWEALRDPQLKQKEREKATTARLEELDSLPQMNEFYEEFSRCVNVEQLLKDIDNPLQPA